MAPSWTHNWNDCRRSADCPALEGANESWLKWYYFVRAAFSAAWVVLAISVAAHSPSLAAILLVAYPLWDALANAYGGAQNGGLERNRTQAFNVAVSVSVAAALCVALLESIWRSMGDDPEWRAVGPCRRGVHFPGAHADGTGAFARCRRVAP